MPLKKDHLADLIREQIVSEQGYREHNYVNAADIMPIFTKVNDPTQPISVPLDIQTVRITYVKNDMKMMAGIRIEGSEFKEPMTAEFSQEWLQKQNGNLNVLVQDIINAIEKDRPEIFVKEPKKNDWTKYLSMAQEKMKELYEHGYKAPNYITSFTKTPYPYLSNEYLYEEQLKAYASLYGDEVGDYLPVEKSIRQILEEAFPQLKAARINCPISVPSCGAFTDDQTLFDIVIHLNDTHKWSRERIADWIEEEALLKGWDIYLKGEEVNVSSNREADQA